MSVGRKVRKWRLSKGMTEREAAARASVSQPTWRAIEADEVKRIGLNVARRVVAACEGVISLDDFDPPSRHRPAA